MTCPHCRWPHRIAATYETRDGIVHDDSYCGRCGRNWRFASVEEAAALEVREREAEGPPAPRRGKQPVKLSEIAALSLTPAAIYERIRPKRHEPADHAMAAANDKDTE